MKNITLLVFLVLAKSLFARWVHLNTLSFDSACSALRLSDNGRVLAIRGSSLWVFHLGDDYQWVQGVLPLNLFQTDSAVLALTGDGDFIATENNNLLMLYSFYNGEWHESQLVSDQNEDTTKISAVAFSHDKERLFIAKGSSISIWGKVKNSYSYLSSIEDTDVMALCVDSKGKTVATLTEYNSVKVWKEQTNHWIYATPNIEEAWFSMDLALSGNYLVLGSDKALQIFNHGDNEWIAGMEICQVTEPIIYVQVTHDDDAILYQVQPHDYNQESINRYDIADAPCRLVSDFFTDIPNASQDENHIICMSGQGNIMGFIESNTISLYRWQIQPPKNARSTKRLIEDPELPNKKRTKIEVMRPGVQ